MIDPLNGGGTRLPAGFDWRNPDYGSIIAARIEYLKRLRSNPALVPALKEFYRERPAQFISDFGWTMDPRNIERGLPARVPFVLFQRQYEFIDWVMARWRAGESGLCEKSRDCGASWLVMALGCTLALFNRGLTVGVGSRKESLLDLSGDPSSLFYKGRMFLESLPREFLGSWDRTKHAPYLRLLFPDTDSAVVGESGDEIGRGSRTALFFVDESAYIERQELLDASLAATTNCVIHVSSANGLDNAFAVKRHSGRISIFTFHHSADPRKGPEWYARQVATLDPIVIASEIDIDYRGSTEGQLIPSAWVTAAIDAHKVLGIEPSGMRYAGLDIADGGRDLCAIALRHGIYLEHVESWSGKNSDTFKTMVRAFGVCETHAYQTLTYDSDGIGALARGDSNVINEARGATGKERINDYPFRGSGPTWRPDSQMVQGRKNRDYFQNAKAQAWWALRLRFSETYRAVVEKLPFDADGIISLNSAIPELLKLQMELSQISYYINQVGKVVVDKAPNGMKSPDLGDALMIAFEPSTRVGEIWAKMAD